MNDVFLKMFSVIPNRYENDIYFYEADFDADQFDEDDIEKWRSGRFHDSLNNKFFLNNSVSRKLVCDIVRRGLPVVEVACGPGMGLIPAVKDLSPKHSCLVTDASSLVISEWKKYLDKNQLIDNIDFAQFSLMNIPFGNECVSAYSTFIGLSSTRNGEAGRQQALKEIFRTLATGGYFYAIEAEWADVDSILGVFEKMNRTPWSEFMAEKSSWRKRFIETGFEILSEETVEYHKFTSDDNELGAAAEYFGIEVGTLNTAYILRKP